VRRAWEADPESAPLGIKPGAVEKAERSAILGYEKPGELERYPQDKLGGKRLTGPHSTFQPGVLPGDDYKKPHFEIKEGVFENMDIDQIIKEELEQLFESRLGILKKLGQALSAPFKRPKVKSIASTADDAATQKIKRKLSPAEQGAQDAEKQLAKAAKSGADEKALDVIDDLDDFNVEKATRKFIQNPRYAKDLQARAGTRTRKIGGEQVEIKADVDDIKELELFTNARDLSRQATRNPEMAADAEEALRKLHDHRKIIASGGGSTWQKMKNIAPDTYDLLWGDRGLLGKGITGTAVAAPTVMGVQHMRSQAAEKRAQKAMKASGMPTECADMPDGPAKRNCISRNSSAMQDADPVKEAIKRMVIEALKKQKVNEQPVLPDDLPKPETMDVKVDMDPDVKMPDAPTETPLTPSQKQDMEMSEDIEFESAQDLKEKIAEEKFNKLVNAIAKK
jgi:hypothetical protein